MTNPDRQHFATDLTLDQWRVKKELLGAPNDVLFGDGEHLDRMLSLALLKIMDTFAEPEATYARTLEIGPDRLGMSNPRRGRRGIVWEHFLPVGDPSIEQLALLTAKAMPRVRKFVRVEDLPECAKILPAEHLEAVRAYARLSLVQEALDPLAEDQTELWRYEGTSRRPGGWQVAESLMSQRHDLRRTLKGLEPYHPHWRNKFDRREYHGRPKRDRDRPQVPVGQSTGRCSYA